MDDSYWLVQNISWGRWSVSNQIIYVLMTWILRVDLLQPDRAFVPFKVEFQELRDCSNFDTKLWTSAPSSIEMFTSAPWKRVDSHFTASGFFGKVSQQTRKVSQQTGKVSQQSGKVSQQTEKVSQQTGKVSQQTGKVSQHPFAVKWQVTI